MNLISCVGLATCGLHLLACKPNELGGSGNPVSTPSALASWKEIFTKVSNKGDGWDSARQLASDAPQNLLVAPVLIFQLGIRCRRDPGSQYSGITLRLHYARDRSRLRTGLQKCMMKTREGEAVFAAALNPYKAPYGESIEAGYPIILEQTEVDLNQADFDRLISGADDGMLSLFLVADAGESFEVLLSWREVAQHWLKLVQSAPPRITTLYCPYPLPRWGAWGIEKGTPGATPEH